ncbi:MAG: hypothetical protein ACRDK9_00220 [Solirubrobacterales bacterium]
MKVFDFDPAEYRKLYAEQEWIHIPSGVTPEFLEAMREFVARSLGDHKVAGPGIGGKGRKDQAVFEFPAEVDFPGEVFDTIAPLSGLNRSTLTLSERHVNAYYSDAAPEPTAHKDRHSSQISVGLAIESPAESRVVVYPSDDRGANPFNVSFALIDSLPPERHPDRILPDAREVEIDDKPGDVVAFPGSSIWHLRRRPAGAVILYLKMNDFGSDPLGEDPSTPIRRQGTLEALADNSNGAVLERVPDLSRRLDTITERYLRDQWRGLIEAQVWEQKPVQLSEWELQLLREVDGQRTLAALLGDVGSTDEESALARVRTLAEREILDLLPSGPA